MQTISEKIEESGSDSSKLYKLVNHLAGHKMKNPLPSRNTDKELANEFVDFFMWKSIKSRNELDDTPSTSHPIVMYLSLRTNTHILRTMMPFKSIVSF